MKEMILKLAKEEDGAGMVEYVLLIALVAVALITGFNTLAGKTSTKLGTVGEQITSGGN